MWQLSRSALIWNLGVEGGFTAELQGVSFLVCCYPNIFQFTRFDIDVKWSTNSVLKLFTPTFSFIDDHEMFTKLIEKYTMAVIYPRR